MITERGQTGSDGRILGVARPGLVEEENRGLCFVQGGVVPGVDLDSIGCFEDDRARLRSCGLEWESTGKEQREELTAGSHTCIV